MFVVGILAALAYRLIVILNHYSALWVQVAWYNRAIEDLSLIKKAQESEGFVPEEKSALVYILKSLQTSLAKWNYIAIFAISSLALIYDIYQDFISQLIK